MNTQSITRGRLKIMFGAAAVALLVVACIVAIVVIGLLTAAPSSAVGANGASPDASSAAALPAAELPVAELPAAELHGAAEHFGVFTHELRAADRAERSRVSASFADRPGSLAAVDFNLARPAPIAGSPNRAWIAPAGNEVCLFVPDPVDGYGATCSSTSDIAAGRAIAILAGAPGDESRAVVAALVPDGGQAPTITDGKTQTAMTVADNVAAATVSSSAKVVTAAGTIDLNFLRADPARACAVGAGCSGK